MANAIYHFSLITISANKTPMAIKRTTNKSAGGKTEVLNKGKEVCCHKSSKKRRREKL